MADARDPRKPAFERMEASLLACPKCKRAVPVRKRLLLILPEGDKYEYVCPQCGIDLRHHDPGGRQTDPSLSTPQRGRRCALRFT